jgi:hypothetical protein
MALIKQFGDDVTHIATTWVQLGPDASLDDFNIAKKLASKIPGDVRVDHPGKIKSSIIQPLIEKMRQDQTYTKDKMEKDIGRLAVNEYYKNKDFKDLTQTVLDAIIGIDFKIWSAYAKTGAQKDLNTIHKALMDSGIKEELIPAISKEFAQKASLFSRTRLEYEQIASCV